MGDGMRMEDLYIGSLLDVLNLRFAPTQRDESPAAPGTENEYFGGLDEMVALQREFEVFKLGRPFADSVAVLGLAGTFNARAKNRWLKVLRGIEARAGGSEIVRTIVENLRSETPKPIYFSSHDSREGEHARAVIIRTERSPGPIFYMNHEYITVSLPMQPRREPGTAR